jgi:hypothetical protein
MVFFVVNGLVLPEVVDIGGPLLKFLSLIDKIISIIIICQSNEHMQLI